MGRGDRTSATWLFTSEGNPRFLLLRYEDLVKDTARELAKVVAFLHLSASPEQIAQAVERSSADNMRKLEQAQTDQQGLTQGIAKGSFVCPRCRFWRMALRVTRPLVARIEAAWGPLMQHLGYELSTQPPSEARDVDCLGMLSGTPR